MMWPPGIDFGASKQTFARSISLHRSGADFPARGMGCWRSCKNVLFWTPAAAPTARDGWEWINPTALPTADYASA